MVGLEVEKLMVRDSRGLTTYQPLVVHAPVESQ